MMSLRRLKSGNRNDWIKANLGQDILCGSLPAARGCSEASDFALAVKVADALRYRAEHGYKKPNVSKAPLGELVKQLIDLSWAAWKDEYHDVGFTSKADLTSQPATEDEIALVERRTGIPLPDDYKELLRITNGYHLPLYYFPCCHLYTHLSQSQVLWLTRGCDDFADSVLGNGDLMKALPGLRIYSERTQAIGKSGSSARILIIQAFANPPGAWRRVNKLASRNYGRYYRLV
jgi:hypothetical protein